MNKTFKRILSASFICFLLLSAFTACSKDDEGQPEKKDMPVLEFAESDNPVITGELYYKVDKEGYIVSK